MRTWARTWGAGLLAAALSAGGCALAGAAPATAGTSWIIRTMAGGAGRGVGRNVSEAPGTIAAWPGGSVYVGDTNGVVRVLHGNSDWETTLAGVGAGAIGFAGDGGPAARARLGQVNGVAVDSAGNVLLADSSNHRIRLVAASTGTAYGRSVTAGDIYTIAGNGSQGFAGDGGPATAAESRHPASVAVDPAGNIVIADTYNHEIRVVADTPGTFYGVAMTAGDIYAVAGKGRSNFSGDGGVSTNASLARPKGIAVDQNGNLVVADTGNQRIRVIAATTSTFYGEAMTAGHIYTVAGRGVSGYAGDSGPATSARLSLPVTVDVTPSGSIAFIDSGNFRIRTVSSS